MNVFARSVFDRAVSRGVAAIFVDHSRNVPRKDGKLKTMAEEKADGVRDHWVHIPASDLIAVRLAFVKGREIVTHARWWERTTVGEGFGETCVARIRMVEVKDGGRVWWSLWEQQAKQTDFVQVDSGVLSAMDEVPLVRIFTG